MAQLRFMENYTKIDSLAGQELNIVSFVMDYVEFHFNGPIIRALSNPIIEKNNCKYQFPESGSRDALCSFIGETVESIILQDEISISLIFAENGKIIIPLDAESYIGPEVMHWCPLDEPMQIW